METQYSAGLSESFLAPYKTITPPWGPMGYVIYKRTYSRIDPNLGRAEEWNETCARVCRGLIELGGKFTTHELEYLYATMFYLRGSVSGRALWQLGTDTVRNVGADSLQNCFSGDTRIITREGIKTLRECGSKGSAELLVKTDNGPQWTKCPIHSFGKQCLYRVEFTDGLVVYTTKDHQWLTIDGKRRIPTTSLQGRRVPLQTNVPDDFDEEGFVHGFIFGDGNLYMDGKYSQVTLFGHKEEVRHILSKFSEEKIWTVKGIERPHFNKLPCRFKSLPADSSPQYALGFILGLIAADGNVRNSIRIHNKDQQVIQQLVKMARSAGLLCRKPYLDSDENPFTGEYREIWCLSISTSNIDQTWLIRKDQFDTFKRSKTRVSHLVRSVKFTEHIEEVWCAQVPEYHNFTLENGAVTGNCWNVSVNDVSAFTFTFNQLMLGGGVGFNILPQYVYELPEIMFNPPVGRVETNDCDFIVPDNREGWVQLLDSILEAFYYTGKPFFYNTTCIRAKGAPIRGFGGVASGPEDLVSGMKNIVRILRRWYKKKLRPIDCMDIMNIIGEIVVSGNVRRSSEISVGDPHDIRFLDAKNWGKQQIPNWRTMSNNSVAADTYDEILPQFWDSGYTPNLDGEMEGEPYGLVNLNNCRRYGRLIDGSDPNNDPNVVGVNPCAEITLGNKEGCNLAEIFLPNIRDEEEFKQVAGILFKACKTISNSGFSDPETHEIVQQHHRIGVGLTGYMQAPQWRNPEVLDRVYKHMRQVDQEYSNLLGIKVSIKRTTMKPSGTLSLLPGVTPGMHGALGRYMLRTVRFSANHPLVQVCRNHGYRVEPKLELDGSHNHDTMIIYFPVETPAEAELAENMDVIDELEVQKELQTYWSDNSVSATHYFEPADVPRIKEWLKQNYNDSVKTTSFLLREGHGFKQAPYQPISEERYHEECAKVSPITHVLIKEGWDDYDDALECDSGHCPVK